MRLAGSAAVIRRIISLFAASPGTDGETPTEVLFGVGFDVEAQLGQPPRLIRPVARIAFVGKDRPDIAVELHDLSRQRRGQQQKQSESKRRDAHHSLPARAAGQRVFNPRSVWSTLLPFAGSVKRFGAFGPSASC